jgi:hypothetical protein
MARPEPPSTTARTATPTTRVATVRGTTVALRAFLLESGRSGWSVRPAPAGPLPVASRRSTEESWMRVLRFDHPQAALAAYPSLLASLASDQPSTRIGTETLIDNRPRGTATMTTDAWMRFDITALYRTWARGGPFPSQGRGIDPGTPLVVDVRPESLAQPHFEARFAGLDRDRGTAPQLRWRVTRGC